MGAEVSTAVFVLVLLDAIVNLRTTKDRGRLRVSMSAILDSHDSVLRISSR